MWFKQGVVLRESWLQEPYAYAGRGGVNEAIGMYV
jgi:hypothetical protein